MTDKLKDNDVKDTFRIEIGGRFNALIELDQSVEDEWPCIKHIYKDCRKGSDKQKLTKKLLTISLTNIFQLQK